MKRIPYVILLLVCAIDASAQLRTTYFMEGTYSRTDMNPALAPTRGYFSLPGMGGTLVSESSNFLSVDNFFYKRNGETVLFLNNQVSASEFANKIPGSPHQSSDIRTTVFGAGFHSKYMYWNFGANLRVDESMTVSKEALTTLKNIGNGIHDMGNTKADALSFLEIYLGVAVPVCDFVTIGGRLKGLIGLAHLQGQADTMMAEVTSKQVKADINGSFKGSGAMLNGNYTPGGKIGSEMFHTSFSDIINNLGSWGLGFDLGVEMRFLDDRLTASLGVTDLGFILWDTKNAVYGLMNGWFEYNSTDLGESSKFGADTGFDALYTESEGGYTSRLNPGMNVGVSYSFFENRLLLGLLSQTRFYRSFTSTELTATAQYNAGDVFSVALSHTFLNKNRPGILGCAFNVHPTGFNLTFGMDFIPLQYVAVDNGVAPKYASSLNFYFALGFNLGRSSYMRNWHKERLETLR